MESSQDSHFTLSSGYKMPRIGLGTDGVFDPEVIFNAVTKIGYRVLDSASRYASSSSVGTAIRKILNESDIKREELFVISKVWIDEVEDVEAACRKQLLNLGVEYFDLYLLHWPIAVRTIKEQEGDQPAVYEKIKIPIHKIWP